MSKEEFLKENRTQNLATTVMLVGLLLFMLAAFGIKSNQDIQNQAMNTLESTISLNK